MRNLGQFEIMEGLSSQAKITWPSILVIFFALMLSATNGFSVTSAILREFGARPANILLLSTIPAAIILPSWRNSLNLPLYFAISLLAFVFFASCSLVPLILDPNFLFKSHTPMVGWVAQYMMNIWTPISIICWFIILNRFDILNEDQNLFTKICLIVVAVSTLFFIDRLLYSIGRFFPGVDGLVPKEGWKLLTGDSDPRPSGLFSEPSLYATWTAFMWPMLWFAKSPFRRRWLYWVPKAAGVLILICAVASGARTMFAVLGAQVLAYVIFTLFSDNVRRSTKIWTASALVGVGLITFILADDRIGSIFDIQENLSSASRWSFQAAGLAMVNDNPFFGHGIGTYSSNLYFYLPNFGVISQEIYSYYSPPEFLFHPGLGLLFLRVWMESGVFAALSLFILMIAPQFVLLRRAFNGAMVGYEPMVMACMLTAVGALTSIAQDDEASYPGIAFATAFALVLLARTEKMRAPVA